MEDESVHRHDISDEFWIKLEPLLPGREGSWGGRAQDNRRFINAVFWILRTGAPWRDLPASYGGWNKIVKNAENLGMKVVIPPRKNRKVLRKYDRNAYKIRRLVENVFLHLKRWRGVATRYCKNLSSFLAAVQIRCLAVWGNVL